jgi:hypothetical protein
MDSDLEDRDNFYDEFGSTFWLTLAGAVFGFLGVCLQAVLKSRCRSFTCWGISCVRDPAPVGQEPHLDISSLEKGIKSLESAPVTPTSTINK